MKDEIQSEFNSKDIVSESRSEEIVGESLALKRVLTQAKKLAQSDSTVLLLGEAGSGKETIARAVHRVSRRRNESFVKIHCRTGATELQESTFFGQHDGSSAKSGRIELANRGTLFLDETARIPLDMQPKVLRALTRGEIERVGSTRTLRINVRWIFASRYDLDRRVAERQFHESLYHQIRRASIMIPPLRERREDISLLAHYFVQKFARRMNKPVATITTEIMDALQRFDWPGNVRQLENFMERSVILTDDSTLQAPLSEL